MISPDGSTGLLPRPRSAPAGANLEFGAVLAILLVTGWVANHFVALMPTISDRQHLSTSTLDAIFGIYAVGLLPGLLIGGRASDALGRKAVALAGSATAVVGTVAMLLSQLPGVLLAGRLIVGVGVGLAMTSGTAWASDLKGPAGCGHRRRGADRRIRHRTVRRRVDGRGGRFGRAGVVRDGRGPGRGGDDCRVCSHTRHSRVGAGSNT